jgi:ligand-binding SRPBCC domain-containing protein
MLVTSIPASLDVVFDLATDLDLLQASMRRFRERAIGGRTSGRIGLGESVTWRAHHLGLPWTMTSRIESYDRPVSFVDAQTRGPFGSYRHEHRFTAIKGGTVMTDLVDVAAPFGRPGRMFEGFAARYLERLLPEGNQAILECATGS